jgi:dihydroorotase
LEEKENPIYVRRPNGSALLNCMLEFYKQELISLEKIVEKCATILLSLSYDKQRIYPEGYFDDLGGLE